MIRIQSKKLKLILRISLGVCYVLLAVLMFVSGRTHTVLFENKKADDGSFTHLGSIEISFDGKEPQELFKGERDKIPLRGQKHKIVVYFTDGREPFKGTFTIPLFEDSVLLSIPALVNQMPEAVKPFKSEADKPEN